MLPARSVNVVGLLRENAVGGCPAYSKRGRNRARRFTARVHPLRQRHFRLVERLGTPNELAACATRIPGCRAALLAKFQLKLSKAGEDSGHIRPEAFAVSMPSRNDRSTIPRSPRSRIVVITSAALRPRRSIPTTTMASPCLA